ncbi:MAG: ACP S-malonyltransferase [Gaiellaceae bacterium]
MRVAFCFPGQGSQAPGMGKELAERSPAVRAVYATASEAAGFDVAEVCFSGSVEELTDTRIQQPALVATSIACLRAIEESGLQAEAVVGHSVGEYAALAACGAIDVAGAIELVRERGIAMAEVANRHPGSMAAIIGLDDAIVEELCASIEGVWPANYNCPGQVVVSGETESIKELLEMASERGARRVVPLRVSGAFHTPLVSAVADHLGPFLAAAAWKEPGIPFVSTVTASFEEGAAIPRVLEEQLAGPVRFTQAVQTLRDSGIDTFVEVGPGKVLSGLIKRCDRSATAASVGDSESLASLQAALGARA